MSYPFLRLGIGGSIVKSTPFSASISSTMTCNTVLPILVPFHSILILTGRLSLFFGLPNQLFPLVSEGLLVNPAYKAMTSWPGVTILLPFQKGRYYCKLIVLLMDVIHCSFFPYSNLSLQKPNNVTMYN